MPMKLRAISSLTALFLTCASLPALAQTPAAPTPAPATPPPPSGDTVLPSKDQLWDVTTITCGNWVDASDDDRAAVGMFYYGWLAGHKGIKQIRPVNIQPNLRKVLDVCIHNRDYTIVHAFETALGSGHS